MKWMPEICGKKSKGAPGVESVTERVLAGCRQVGLADVPGLGNDPLTCVSPRLERLFKQRVRRHPVRHAYGSANAMSSAGLSSVAAATQMYCFPFNM